MTKCEQEQKARDYWDTLPEGIKEAMVRIRMYKRGQTAYDVFGQSVGRDGYRDDCQLVADYVSATIIDAIGAGVK